MRDLWRVTHVSCVTVITLGVGVRTAKCNVDQTVCAANAPLDPYSERREENGDDAEEDVGSAHVDWCFCTSACAVGVQVCS